MSTRAPVIEKTFIGSAVRNQEHANSRPRLLKPEDYLSLIVQVIAVISVSIFSAFALRSLLMIEFVSGGLIGLGGYVGLILFVDPPDWTLSVLNSIKAITRSENHADQFVIRHLKEPINNIKEVSKWLRQHQPQRLTKTR
jgi:hypothetical protein